ncbi:hypothetical protein C8Q73DRAFT_644418 [Cubamyces lactineus]|nr:hypothetical protein C8Q73DRAFT_644418 [Cubamyces lactineus]
MPKNQHKPLPPEEVVRPWLELYWDLGMNDKVIAENIRDHIDCDTYGISQRSVRRLRDRWGLRGVRSQKHTLETIHAKVQEIRQRFPTMGARSMVVHLRQNYGIRVPEALLLQYFHIVEPASVAKRKGRRFKRKQYWTAGVNDVWCFDQHDKWLRFGLFFHLGFEPCAGQILYIKVWWTNHNPWLITSYYLQAARRIGGVPLVTQSDPGSENFGIANCHTEIRHHLDPSLRDTLQHRWMRNKTNIKPEIVWSLFRRGWSPGFETILDEGRLNGLYDVNEPLERLVFLWVMVPWLQREVDTWVHQFNNSARRADKNKVLPQGIPSLIAAKPDRFGVLDFKVSVPDDLFDHVQQRWAPPDHSVFQLVPQDFDALAQRVYVAMGSPIVTSATAWDVYVALLGALRRLPELPDLSDALATWDAAAEEEVELLAGLRNLRHGEEAPVAEGLCYLGGLDAPSLPNPTQGSSDDGPVRSRDIRLIAELTDFEDDDHDENGEDGTAGGPDGQHLYAVFSD